MPRRPPIFQHPPSAGRCPEPAAGFGPLPLPLPLPLTGVSDGGSTAPMLSEGSDWLVFESAATNLIAGDTGGARDVFLADIGDLPAVELEAAA